MSKPSSPELARSGRTSVDPGSAAATAPLAPDAENPGVEGAIGPVPEGNRPGRHRPHDEDQPDLDAFARRLGVRGRGGRTSSRTDADRVDDRRATGDGSPASVLGHVTRAAARAARIPRAVVGTGLAATEASLAVSLAAVRRARRRVVG